MTLQCLGVSAVAFPNRRRGCRPVAVEWFDGVGVGEAELRAMVTGAIDTVSDTNKIIDDNLSGLKAADPTFVNRAILQLHHMNTQLLSKLRVFDRLARGVDLCMNVLPLKEERAERAATVREFQGGMGSQLIEKSKLSTDLVHVRGGGNVIIIQMTVLPFAGRCFYIFVFVA